MEKWAIRPYPAPYDPRRHVLLFKGSMNEISLILKKFGSMCGRPSRTSTPEGYNFSLPLHGLTQLGLERLSAILNELGPKLPPSPVAAPSAALPERAESEVLGPAANGAAAAGPGEPLPAVQAPAPEAEAPPAPTPAEAAPSPALTPPPEAEPALIPLGPEEPTGPAGPRAESVPAATPAPTIEPVPVQAVALRAKPLWGLRETIDPGRNFDSLSVGPYNRFAHAAVTSVVGAPGSMYNPLFLYGAPGVGKTHMLHAVSGGLAQAVGEENVILTTGTRLSHAVSAAFAEGRFAGIDALCAQAKALLVDDVHLLAVTEQNKPFLAKVFGLFFSRNLQVVFTSIYPPRGLGALEEALRISFAKGWSVDLKVPSPTVQVDFIQAFMERNEIDLSMDEIKAFYEKLGGNYSEATRWMRRLKAQAQWTRQSGQAVNPGELINILFAPDVPEIGSDMPSEGELQAMEGFVPPAPGPEARNLAVILPKGHEKMLPWVVSRFFQAGAQAKTPQSYRLVLTESYDAGQPFGVPFQLGEMCLRAGADALLLVGPPNDTSLAARLSEFSHAVGHILESFDIALGWIPHRGTTCPPHFLRAHLDFTRPEGTSGGPGS